MGSSFSIEIRNLYISGGHDFKGRFGQQPLRHEISSMDSVRCVAGLGLEGDRYFGYKENWKGQITFIGQEAVDEISSRFELPNLDPSVFRRNVVAQGVDWNTLVGKRFRIGEVHFEGSEPCAPCFWMDQVVAPGALKAMKDKGGLRCRILSSGILRLGRTDLELVHGAAGEEK